MKSKKAIHSFLKLSIKDNRKTTTGNCTVFNNEFEQTSEMKPHIKIIAMINQLKRCIGIDFSFTFKLGFNCLINTDSFIFRLRFGW